MNMTSNPLHLGLVMAAALGAGGAASAATITVDTVADVRANDGDCSLREAIDNAFLDAATWADCVAGSGGDSIAFAPSLFSGSPPTASIALDPAEGQLSIGGDSLTIAPPSGSRLRVLADGSHRVMYVATVEGAAFELRDTELSGGTDFFGGGLYRSIGFESGSLLLRNCRFQGNSTGGNGAAVHHLVNGDDDLRIENCRFQSNQGNHSGAISVEVQGIEVAGTPELEIVDSVFADNLAQNHGGALRLAASSSSARHLVRIEGSSFSGNRVGLDGGAIHQEADPQTTAIELDLIGNSFHGNVAGHENANPQDGGALNSTNAALRLSNNLFVSNFAGREGAALRVRLYDSILPRAFGLSGNTFIGNSSDDPDSARTVAVLFPSDAGSWVAVLRGNAFAASDTPTPNLGECALIGNDLQIDAGANIAAHPSCTFGPGDTVADPELVLAATAHPVHPLSAYPAAGSPAIDLWPSADCLAADGSALDTDLLGDPRPRNGDGSGAADCDAGAFELPDAGLLTVSRAGAGSGRVLSEPGGIDCGSACATGFTGGTQVALTAAAEPGSVFSGWSDDCSGLDPCALEIDGDRTVTASFDLAASHDLSVARSGDGTGSVASSPSGIACAPLCSASFAAGSQVTLTATSAADAVFSGWSGGGCSGTGSCVVTLGADTGVTAEFTATAFVVEVARVGSGLGSVASDPVGIDCPGDCSELFDRSETVTLSATASTGSRFIEWQGDCSGDADCLLDMDLGPFLVDARFELLRLLQLSLAGSGSGAVQSSPVGIDCPGSCSAEFDNGTQVTLTATPAPGSVFAGWSGTGSACPGTGDCVLSMDSARSVTATFQTGLAALTVSVAGGGRVTSQPAGIDCPGDCSESFSGGTQVTLSALPMPGVVFSHWDGACSGSGACVVTMNSAQSVVAHYVPGPIFANGFE